MTLWFVFAVMTAGAVLAVLWPLGRGRAPVRCGSDVAVYRDQLDEIERDRAEGSIGVAEARAARIEVSRRLLAADAAAHAGTAPSDDKGSPGRAVSWRRRAVAVAALVGLPLGAGGLYVALGSPDLPGQPLALRGADPAMDPSI